MTLFNVSLAIPGGLDSAVAMVDYWHTVVTDDGVFTGRVRMAMTDGPDRALIALDPTVPGKCPRCGHDADGDPSRRVRMDGDHLVIIEGPLAIDAGAVNTEFNHVTFRASQPYIFVWCSERDTVLSRLRVTREEPPA